MLSTKFSALFFCLICVNLSGCKDERENKHERIADRQLIEHNQIFKSNLRTLLVLVSTADCVHCRNVIELVLSDQRICKICEGRNVLVLLPKLRPVEQKFYKDELNLVKRDRITIVFDDDLFHMYSPLLENSVSGFVILSANEEVERVYGMNERHVVDSVLRYL